MEAATLLTTTPPRSSAGRVAWVHRNLLWLGLTLSKPDTQLQHLGDPATIHSSGTQAHTSALGQASPSSAAGLQEDLLSSLTRWVSFQIQSGLQLGLAPSNKLAASTLYPLPCAALSSPWEISISRLSLLMFAIFCLKENARMQSRVPVSSATKQEKWGCNWFQPYTFLSPSPPRFRNTHFE